MLLGEDVKVVMLSFVLLLLFLCIYCFKVVG